MKHHILRALCLTLLFLLPGLSYGESSKVAYDVEDIESFTHTLTPFRLASKQEWLLHDSRLKDYRNKLGANDAQLVDDQLYQQMKRSSLEARHLYYRSSLKINATKASIDDKQVKMARKIDKMAKRAEDTFDSVWVSMAKYHKSFNNDFEHDRAVEDFTDDAGIFSGYYDRDSIPPVSSCRNLALRYISSSKLLYGFYNHKLKSFRAGKKIGSLSYLESTIERDIAFIGNIPGMLNDAIKPRHIKKDARFNEKNWRFCTKVAIKVSRDTAKLYSYLLYFRKSVFGEPIDNKQVTSYLNEN